MKVNLEREGTNVVKLGVEVEPERATKAYEQVCRSLSQRVKIPGFRPGKAPRKMVEQTVGVDMIKREALEHLVPEILGQVITDEKLDVITEPQIDSWKFELGQPLELSARFEVRPEVTLGDYKGLSVKVEQTTLDDDSMDKALQAIAENKASLKTIEGRAVKMGDTVLMDFECFVDDKLVEGGKAEGLLLEIKEGNFLEGFCEQVVGKNAGDKSEIKATFPENYRNTELAGKNAVFKVEVKEVRERQIPPIDDELAKSINQESLDALKEALKQRLEEEVKNENESRLQRAVVEAVVANAKVEIPESMIDRECNLLLSHLRQYLEQGGQSWDAFVQSPEYEALYKEKRDEAQQRVQTSLVLGAVVKAENITLGEEEWHPYLVELIGRYNLPIEQIQVNKDIRRAFEELRRQAMEEALTRKIVDFLTEQAKVDYVPEAKTPAEAAV